MGDEHLHSIPATKSDEFTMSSVENVVSNPSESKDLFDSECDVPACDDFTTFSNLLFDVDDYFSSGDDELFFDEDFSKEIYSNHLFDEEIISIKIDPHHFNAESDLIESLLNHDSSINSSSSKIDSLLDEFAGELILLKMIPLGIDETNCDPEDEIRLIEKLLYDNSSACPPKEFIFENSDAAMESFSPSPIPVEDSDSFMEEIDLSFILDNPMPPGIKEDNYDSERDMLIYEELLSNNSLSLPKNDKCDVPACDDFITFSNLLFDVDDYFSSIDDESFSDEDISKEIYSNPLFDEEIISIKIDPHHFNAESDLLESLLNHDSSIISSSKIDSLLDEFAGELTPLKSIPPEIDEIDCDHEEEIFLIEKLLYDNSSPRPREEFISEKSDATL
uniref:Reverse transcriptase domain-containing protein n=1 Tax=Tanacetum cinerariifolium TaxID=118510 RepID=A0A699ID62_TANCI|nr:hypothetical protein [Tanacetum cinerariifolium]